MVTFVFTSLKRRRTDALSTSIVVIDCKDPNKIDLTVKVYLDTPEGNAEAEATFEEWVQQAAGEAFAIEDKVGQREILDAALENGYYEVGEGFIAITHAR